MMKSMGGRGAGSVAACQCIAARRGAARAPEIPPRGVGELLRDAAAIGSIPPV